MQDSEGVQRYQNSLHFKFFPISVEGGGFIENQFFPKFKKVQITLGEGGGVKKIMDFFHKFYNSLHKLAQLDQKDDDSTHKENLPCGVA